MSEILELVKKFLEDDFKKDMKLPDNYYPAPLSDDKCTLLPGLGFYKGKNCSGCNICKPLKI